MRSRESVGLLDQLVDRWLCKPEVASSNLAQSTTYHPSFVGRSHSPHLFCRCGIGYQRVGDGVVYHGVGDDMSKGQLFPFAPGTAQVATAETEGLIYVWHRVFALGPKQAHQEAFDLRKRCSYRLFRIGRGVTNTLVNYDEKKRMAAGVLPPLVFQSNFPTTALILRTPAAADCSFWILKPWSSPVCCTWGPPQISTETSPME